MYRDFGVGQMGDMGAHTMDLVWNAIDAGAPTAIEVDQEVSDKYDPNICPVKLKVTLRTSCEQVARAGDCRLVSGRPEARVRRRITSTYRGSANGAIFEGTKGSIFADFTSRVIIPNNDDGDLTYYKRRTAGQLLPLVGGTGKPTQAVRKRRVRALAPAGAAQPPCRPDSLRCPARQPGPNGFPEIQIRRRQDSRGYWACRTRYCRGDSRGREERQRRLAQAIAFQTGMAGRLQGQEQQCRPRDEQQDALRFRLLRHNDRADAAGSGRASRRQEARVRSAPPAA